MSSGSLGSGDGFIANFLPSGPVHFGQAEYRNNFKIEATYDERKRLVELTMNNGIATNENLKYRYDIANRKRIEAIIGNKSRISQHDFDNRSRLLTSKHGVTTPIPNALSQAENDAAIAVVQGNSGTALFEEEFSYNDTDERLKYSETSKPDKNYSYLNGHRIQSDGVETYTFHIDGILSNDGTEDFRANSMGRVIRIEQGGTTVLEIEYDALGRPSIIQESGKPKLTFHYFGKFVEQENHNGVPHRQYTLHPLSGNPIAYHITGTSFYSLFDSRSNLIALTDMGGNLLETYRYKSFGFPAIFDSGGTELSDSAFNVEPIFGGQRHIDSVGLYLSMKRLMDPVNGIFLSPDPKGHIDSPSLYVYAAQNPIDYFDRSGEEKSSNDDWKLFDNPIWNVITNDALGLATSSLEEAKAFGNFDTLTRSFGWMEAFGKNRFSRFLGRTGSKASYFLDDLVRLPAIKFPSIFSRGISITSLGMSRINSVLAPLGLISNSMSLHEAIFTSNKSLPERWADGFFSGAGLVSSSIGTTALIGKGLALAGLPRAGAFLLRIASNPIVGRIGLLAGAAAGGYAVGSLIRKTGYGDFSGSLGASVTKNLLEYDSFLPDFLDTGGSYALGLVVTVGGVIVVEPVMYLGKGLNAIDEAIMPEGRTLNPMTGIKSILNWENPFW